jgi:putative transposase
LNSFDNLLAAFVYARRFDSFVRGFDNFCSASVHVGVEICDNRGQFQRLMADHGITCSMSRSGNVWDNAAMESFFSSLKTERTARKVYRTRDDGKADVFDYIERFYNPRRRHSTLGYMSPVEFEEQAMLA